jgi:hypothetical protein
VCRGRLTESVTPRVVKADALLTLVGRRVHVERVTKRLHPLGVFLPLVLLLGPSPGCDPFDPLAPPSPSGLEARGKDGKIDVTWEAADGAARYEVFRSLEAAGPFLLIGATQELVLVDAPVPNHVMFHYRVRSVGADHRRSQLSDPTSAEAVSRSARRGELVEICNGADDDGDGMTDEEQADIVTGVDVGICVPEIRTCTGGAYAVVQAGVPPLPEQCDSGVDEDCTGRQNDAPDCVPSGILAFNGELSIQIDGLEPIPFVSTGVATVGDGGAHLDMLRIDGGSFRGAAYLEITDPGASPIAAVSAAAVNGSGTFSGAAGSSSGVFGGRMAIPGAATVCLFTSTCTGGAIVVPFTINGTKGVGLGGTPTPHATVGAAIQISLTGAGWTVGTVGAQSGPAGGPYTTGFATGYAHGPASAGLSSAAQASGVVSLVTPVQVNTNIGPSAAIPVFVRLTLHFEPAVTAVQSVLPAAAIGLLLVAAWRRTRKSPD